MKSLLLLPFLLLSTTMHQVHAQTETLEQKTTNAVDTIMEQARKKAQTIKLPTTRYSEQGKQAAKQTADFFYSSAFQERIQNEQRRLEKDVCKEYIASWQEKQPTADRENSNLTDNFAARGKIYLFLSSSVPDETVHAYLTAISKTGSQSVTPVMRGLINGLQDTKASANYFSQILKVDQSCGDTREPEKVCPRFKLSIRINPLLFAEYRISRVPTLVYANETETFTIQGDTGLDYLLERINQELHDKDPALTSLARTIRGEQ
ncbi:TrbC family F-type conjugative pilus assembly protein [Desulfogranum marinum]|uniref:TrbC family F-type conjugative pilus assembly protein n=1 Tax=Desulfogranum marinum TaxID=453220 RepID=UPI0029C9A181|nr:TrbC family F-type conjugative pilus assembly protein [Desulfogranum marinum]